MTAPDHVPYASPTFDYERRVQDDGHLKALVVCHYVWAGLIAILALIPLIHVFLGVAMIRGMFADQPNPPPPELGWFFVVFGAGAILLGEAIAALNVYSALQISRRRRRVLSIVVAGINCLSVPLGTLLGIFTIIVLARDSVRLQYAERSGASPPPAAPHPAWS